MKTCGCSLTSNTEQEDKMKQTDRGGKEIKKKAKMIHVKSHTYPQNMKYCREEEETSVEA